MDNAPKIFTPEENKKAIQKMVNYFLVPFLAVIMLLFVWLYSAKCIDYDKVVVQVNNYYNIANQKTIENEELTAKLEKLANPTKTKYYTFESGNFIAGDDFEAGVYNITAMSGYGNVYSDNAYDGGINAVMASKADNIGGLGEEKYSNIKLPDGTTLTIGGVKVRLTKVG